MGCEENKRSVEKETSIPYYRTRLHHLAPAFIHGAILASLDSNL